MNSEILTPFSVIDLFSGCGGLSLGFDKAGYTVALGIDNWKDAITTFKKNHTSSQGMIADLNQMTPKEITQNCNISKIDVIVGGPPCQGFSIAGKQIIDDERNKLYKSFVRFVDFFRPKAFLMENVPNIMTMGGGTIRNNILLDFTNLGYRVSYKVLLAADYGVPQNRKRAFFVGLLNGKSFDFPARSCLLPITTKQAISDLPEFSVEDGTSYLRRALSPYQDKMRENSLGIYNHSITAHSDTTIQIVSQVPDGGNYKNLPIHLQGTRNVHIAWTRLNSGKPSFTIDTGHRHHFHYKYNRIPTVRESARLQAFPDNFIFSGSKTSQYKQVGNAVPPLVSYELAKKIKEHL